MSDRKAEAQRKLDGAVATYKEGMRELSQRDLAEWEAEIWDLFGQVASPPRPLRKTWFEQTFGVRGHDTNVRHLLYNAGAWVAPLWEGLDRKSITMDTAKRLCVESKKKAEGECISCEKALSALLSAHEERFVAPERRPAVQAELDAKIEAYRGFKGTLFEMAKLEAEIYDLLSKVTDGARPDRGVYFSTTFGTPIADARRRSSLYKAGAWVQPLWDRLERRATTLDRVHRIRERAVKATDKTAALDALLKEHDKRARDKGGTHSGAPNSNAHPPKSTEAPSPRASAPPMRSCERTMKRRGLRSLVQSEVMPFLDSLNVPEPFRLEVADAFLLQFDMLLEDFEREAKREAKRPLATHVSQSAFRAACDLLSVEGRWGRSVDLHKARVRKGKLQAPVHPDKFKSGEWPDATRERFEEFEAAYDILRGYQEQLFGGAKKATEEKET